MGLTRKDVLKLFGGASVAVTGGLGLGVGLPPGAVEAADAGPRDLGPLDRDSIITRDVCVIGGGASGTYAAIRLRDLGRSVALVEVADRLGGHTQTYTDPASGTTVDLGVRSWTDLPVARSWFARFDVPLVPATFAPAGRSLFADLSTGKEVVGYTPPVPTAFGAYGALLAQYPYLGAGFDLPDPVPAELLEPFGDFVARHDLQSIVSIVQNFGQGLGDLLRQPTLYVVKTFGLDRLRGLSGGSFLSTSRRNNSELYAKARTELGADALLGSRVVAADRAAHGGVDILVRTPAGARLIRAGKLVVAIPPMLGNLRGFDLDETERGLFRQFGASASYTGLISDSGIPDDLSIRNTGDATRYNLPEMPGIYQLSPTGIPGVHGFTYGSLTPLPDRAVQDRIVADLDRLRVAGTLPTTRPQFVAFAAHSPYELTVPTEAIRAGFYRRLSDLQGRNNTFYTGAAFHTHDSSLLWRFTELLLPRITG